MTARELLTELTKAQCLPSVEGEELVFSIAPPDELAAAVRVLQTGLRAVLTGKRWFGLSANGRGAGRPDGTLNPAGLLPRSARLATVEGDSQWDRLPLPVDKVTARLFTPEAKRAA
ncbi:hypothetical protein [Limnoglobus roseus]|uniref:Uncharacterized protein n=1 Tax=Limnoglobus roseus TaxID=2598579 RepID=A0A5C1ACX4_9BACT|nr:hypothetical protein [Limnoglobus roseus]QEL15622.1 hypothetical protein PX52LOC_02555 [Limnoglobus roseus]